MEDTNNGFAHRNIQRTAAEIRAKYAHKCTETKSPIFRRLWGLLLSDRPDGEKVTGLAIALHADSETHEAYPSIGTLAAICRRKDKRSTRRHVQALHQDGFIDYKPGNGAGNKSRYKMRPVPQATIDELTGAFEKGDSHAPFSAEERGTGEAQKGDFSCTERGTFHAQKGDSPAPRSVQGSVQGNSTHTAEPKLGESEPSRRGVCEKRPFPWEEGQKQADHNVVDFATKRHGSASPRPAEPSAPDAADERFAQFWRKMPRNTRANFGSTLAVWQRLSADEQQFALDAVQHHRERLTREAEAAGRDLDGHMHYAKAGQLPEQWLMQRNFYNYRDEVEKERAERVPGFPPGVQRPEVRNRIRHYLLMRRERPDDAKWLRLIFDPADNDTGAPHYKWEERQRELLGRGSPDAVQPIADLGPAPDDPDCILPPCIMDGFREEIASLMARAEQNAPGVAGMA